MSALIGIAGGSGSGKSTLALMIQQHTGPERTAIVPIDAFYHSLPPGESAAAINYDHPDSLDFAALETCLAALSRGESADVPEYDFSTHTRVGKRCQEPAPLIIVEGILALAHTGVRRRLHVAVFVSAPESIRFQRRLDRDARERGRSETSIREQWARTVEPMHREFVEPTQALAQLIIDGTRPFDHEVVRILSHANSGTSG